MARVEPQRIRNLALVGHRGVGKTSLAEALLYQAEAINRLGTVEARNTVCDWDEDEHKRQMSLAAAIAFADWRGHKINLVDTPGDAGFQGDAIAALAAVDAALVVVSGVMGVEVGTARLWRRAEAAGLARLLFVNMLDRERADFSRTLAQLQEQLSQRCVAVSLPIGAEHDLAGVVDLLHMRAFPSPGRQREGEGSAIPAQVEERAAEQRETLIEAVVESDEQLMERYLEGEELAAEDVARALRQAVARGDIFPVLCGVATDNLGTRALLDLIVEGVPSPADRGSPVDVDDAALAAFVFKTISDPFAGRISVFRVVTGTLTSDSNVVSSRGHKERVGQLLALRGKEHVPTDAVGEGDIGAVAKLKDTATGDLLLDRELPLEPPRIDFPEPVMSFAVTAKSKADEDKMASALPRLTDEDPTLRVQRDPRTGELILSGMSQMHVQVAVDRLKRRFGVEVELHEPRVPYLETIRSQARGYGRHKKQTGGRGQFGDCHIVIEPLDGRQGYEFVDEIVGGVIPQQFRPGVDKGIQEAMQHGELAGAPVTGVRVRLVDGKYHPVDSSELAFKIAGSLAFKDAYQKANPVLLEPIMEVEVTVPDDTVGAVNGDLNARRARLQGMDSQGGMTVIKAEVPLAEMLTYSQSLTSLTGGRGDYSMSFLRYEEVPAHIAQRIIEEARKAREAAKG
jgi:elongation factor G